MSVAAIVVAAGSGERLGAALPKAMVLLRGRPLYEWSAVALGGHSAISAVVLVVPPTEVTAIAERFRDAAGCPVSVVAGGRTRQESVRRGLDALAPDADLVLVHDAARPLVPAEVIDRVVAALSAGARAVIPVLEVSDTIKVVGSDATVTATLDRASLRAVQTPQGFGRSLLQTAHDSSKEIVIGATDDAGMVEALGIAVLTVPGSPLALKITTPQDLLVADVLAPAERADSATAAGFGSAS